MMRVDLLVPDGPPAVRPAPPAGAGAFGALLDAASATLDRADGAERAFAAHRGGMLEMVVERARADVALQIATAAAQRTTQALQSVLGMNV